MCHGQISLLPPVIVKSRPNVQTQYPLNIYLKNVDQNYFKNIYRGNQPSKQIRNPNIEIRNKPGPQEIPKSENPKPGIRI
jgi:hypothetical protein